MSYVSFSHINTLTIRKLIMINKNLENMVNALLSSDNDKAKEHLSDYLNATAAKLLKSEDSPTDDPATK